MKRTLIWIALTSLGISAGPGCSKKEQHEAAKLQSFPVRVETVTRRDMDETLILVGSIKAKDEATLFSRVPGKLLKNLVKEGDRIQRGSAVSLVERDEVGVKFEPAPVPSTLTGIIARVYLDRGANVALNTPIALVVNQHTVLAQADIPERYAGKVKLNDEVRISVDAHPDQRFMGKVSRVSPVVDPTTRTAHMEAEFDNSLGLLQSGMFAKLSLVLARKKGALSIPPAATMEGSNAIFVQENGKAKKKEVEIGLRTEEYVEIIRGLSEGEKVITFGLFGLKDGSPIEVLP